MTTTQGTKATSRRRVSLPLAAAAVIGAMLPFGVSPVEAASPTERVAPQLKQAADPGYAGYASTASGSPIRVEIYEPTIPIPASPQAELNYGYSAIVADSTSARSRASYLWPGDSVGEGFKTIVENLGFPEEISGPLGEQGYAVQVNAVFPGGPESETDEPFPGTVQRATAKEDFAVASNGYSTDGEVKDEDDTKGGNDGNGEGGTGTPLDEILENLPNASGGLGGLLGSSAAPMRARAAEEPPPTPLLPPELSVLLDTGGFSSISRTSSDKIALSQSRANVGNISLLGGLVTIEGVKTLARTTSDGKKGKAEGEAVYGDLVAFGQRFRYGTDGYEAVGQKDKIPGLPDDAAKALETIGLKISTPKPQLTTDGDAATALVRGLVLDFDTTALKSQLGPVTDLLNTLAGSIPDDAKDLRSLVQAAANLSPRIVFVLGTSSSDVDTSQPIVIPEVEIPVTEPETAEQPAAPSGGGSSSVSTGGTDSAAPDSSAPIGESPTTTTDSGDIVPVVASQQPGLPALFSIPTLMILLGVGLASLFGSYVRRLGLAALGGSASCPHGLTSGLPDLRKMS
ncbi:choice-of-anchor P family protein [Nocardioides sp.]|uniref:choice-of-anchor P family protein n=1 Tax=Nocardioides sp. TaxID=35761 RepID=UPI002B26F7A5|nr:choice-of-anchor P family protein [Nocardioides sp.]